MGVFGRTFRSSHGRGGPIGKAATHFRAAECWACCAYGSHIHRYFGGILGHLVGGNLEWGGAGGCSAALTAVEGPLARPQLTFVPPSAGPAALLRALVK